MKKPHTNICMPLVSRPGARVSSWLAHLLEQLTSKTVADKKGRWFTQSSRDQISWTTRQGVGRSATWLPGERLVIHGSRPDPIPESAILVGDPADFRD